MTFGKVLSSTLRALALLAIALGANATPETAINFSPPAIPAGGTATLVIVVDDTGPIGFTGGAISATYDPNVVNTGTILSDTCGGTTVANAGVNSISSTNMFVPPLGSCMIQLQVTSSVAGTYPLTIGPGNPTASTGSNVGSASSTLTVVAPPTVTNTNDSGAGSLRDAINVVNSWCGLFSSINFNIPGTGPFMISPAAELPAINCGILVDGYSQPGSAMNTNATGGNNAAIMIDLNGSSCSGCNGLILGVSGIQVQGLAIRSFGGSGIASNIGGGTNTILGNYIGTDPGGMVAAGNGVNGITVAGGYANIGDGNAAGRNLVTASSAAGILVINGGATITGNQVGGLRDASPGAGNGNHGIYLDAANYSPDYITGNLVIGNANAGIAVTASTVTRVVIQANEVSGNSGPGIDINDDGVNANDDVSPPYDTDSVQNYPVVTSVAQVAGNTIVSGYLRSTANQFGTVFLYANAAASGFNEGGTFLTSIGISTDATGNAPFTATVGGLWDNISAQATLDTCGDGCLRSSEYSPRTAATDPFVVTNTNDSGAGSLRNALDFAFQSCVPKRAAAGRGARLAFAGPTITFNIPGAGIQTIRPATPLPWINCDGLVVDGFTQPGARPNAQGVGDDAVRLIELNGASAPVGANGLQITGSLVTIRGLIINDFANGAGIQVETLFGLPGPQIVGNVIGTDATGSVRKKNSYGVRNGAEATGVGIGSPAAGDRNIISGNDIGVRILSGDVNALVNNYIGLNPAGSAAQGNDTGVSVTGGTNLFMSGNTVSGNLNDGISLRSSTGTSILGNNIGTNATGTAGIPNAFSGISFADAGALGSVGPNNTIAFNSGNGVQVMSNGVSIRGSNIHSNGGLGIELNNSGSAPANDSCDTDAGANSWQNYPVITSVTVFSDHINVTGTLDTNVGRTFGLDFFANAPTDAAANRAGRLFLGSASVAATTCGAATPTAFNVDIPVVTAVGNLITATATDGVTGDTSVFSNAFAAAPPATATLAFDTAALAFGPTLAGATSAPQTVRVTNIGGADAHLVVPSTSAAFTISSNTCPATLLKAAFCDVSIVFSPPSTATGTLTGQLSVTSDATSSPNLLPMSGVVAAAAPPPAPVASLTPPSLSFAARTVSTTSPAQTVTLANTGTAPLTISSIGISGDFAYASSCGLSVAPGGSCTIDVTFTPLVAGVRAGNLTVTDNAAGSPHIVPLGGTGLSSSAAVMNVAPSVVVFSVQQVGSSSAPEIVTVSNSGTAPLTFGSIGVSGEFSIGTPPGASPPACPVTLAPGASCRIAIVFHPAGLNQRQGVLSIVSNAGTATLTVMGTGLVAEPPQLTMAATLDFGAQPVGVPSDGRPFEIRNTSPFVATISDLAVTGDFTVSDTCLTIAAGAACSPLITFQPSVLGPRTGTLTIRTLRDANPYTVNLSGVGEENRRPALQISPVRVGFGNTFLGQLVTRDVVLRNTGLAPLTVSGVAISGDFFTDGGCVGSIVPGASCSVRVTFAPGIPGGRNGVMLVTSNAPGSPHTVDLSGTGCIIPSLTAARLGVLLCGP
jgi:parallel beta-helix repeat protein